MAEGKGSVQLTGMFGLLSEIAKPASFTLRYSDVTDVNVSSCQGIARLLMLTLVHVKV